MSLISNDSQSKSAPTLAVECSAAVRSDQQNMTRADEFLDTDEVLNAKVEVLANMLKAASRAILYTGAGTDQVGARNLNEFFFFFFFFN